MSDEIQRALGRIEGKLDAVIDTQKEHATKIDGLERVKAQALVLVTTFSIAIPLLWDSLKRHFGKP